MGFAMEGKFAEPENTFASRTKWQDITNLSKVTSNEHQIRIQMLPSGALLQLWAETCQTKTWRKETWCNIDKNGKQGDARLETYKWTSTLMTVSVRALNRHIAQSISKCRMKGDIWSKRRRIRPTWDESTESLTPESETNETPKTRSYLYTVCNSCVYMYNIYIYNKYKGLWYTSKHENLPDWLLSFIHPDHLFLCSRHDQLCFWQPSFVFGCRLEVPTSWPCCCRCPLAYRLIT